MRLRVGWICVVVLVAVFGLRVQASHDANDGVPPSWWDACPMQAHTRMSDGTLLVTVHRLHSRDKQPIELLWDAVEAEALAAAATFLGPIEVFQRHGPLADGVPRSATAVDRYEIEVADLRATATAELELQGTDCALWEQAERAAHGLLYETQLVCKRGDDLLVVELWALLGEGGPGLLSSESVLTRSTTRTVHANGSIRVSHELDSTVLDPTGDLTEQNRVLVEAEFVLMDVERRETSLQASGLALDCLGATAVIGARR